jgi:hypothetical protein
MVTNDHAVKAYGVNRSKAPHGLNLATIWGGELSTSRPGSFVHGVNDPRNPF